MNFTVKEVGTNKQFESKFGTMVAYRLTVLGEEGMPVEVELNQKLDTPAPIEGQQIWGHIEPSEFGNKLKKDQKPDGPVSSPSALAVPQTAFQPSLFEDEKQAMIIRQNALTNATAYATAKANLLLSIGKAKAEVSLKPEEAAEWLKDYAELALEELTGKHIVEVQYYFAKASQGKVNLTMTPAEVAEAFGYEFDEMDEQPPIEEPKENFDVDPDQNVDPSEVPL